jgi:hypothetical protein
MFMRCIKQVKELAHAEVTSLERATKRLVAGCGQKWRWSHRQEALGIRFKPMSFGP